MVEVILHIIIHKGLQEEYHVFQENFFLSHISLSAFFNRVTLLHYSTGNHNTVIFNSAAKLFLQGVSEVRTIIGRIHSLPLVHLTFKFLVMKWLTHTHEHSIFMGT